MTPPVFEMMSSVRGGAKPRWTPRKHGHLLSGRVGHADARNDARQVGVTGDAGAGVGQPVGPLEAARARAAHRGDGPSAEQKPVLNEARSRRRSFRRLLSTSTPDRAVGVSPFSCSRSWCSKCARTPKSVSLAMPNARWCTLTRGSMPQAVIFAQASFVAAGRVEIRHAAAVRIRRVVRPLGGVARLPPPVAAERVPVQIRRHRDVAAHGDRVRCGGAVPIRVEEVVLERIAAGIRDVFVLPQPRVGDVRILAVVVAAERHTSGSAPTPCTTLPFTSLSLKFRFSREPSPCFRM